MTQRIPDAEIQQGGDLERMLAQVATRMGFVPNSMKVMAHWPEMLAAFGGFGGVVLGSGVLDPGLKQLLAFVTSNAAGCRYCQAHTAHGAHARGVDDARLAAVFEFEHSPLFSAAERAALRIAARAGMGTNAVEDADFEDARRHYSARELVEIVAVTSLFGFLNRWNDTLSTALEAEPTAFALQALAPGGWDAGRHGG